MSKKARTFYLVGTSFVCPDLESAKWIRRTLNAGRKFSIIKVKEILKPKKGKAK